MNKRCCSRYMSHQSWRLYTLNRLFPSTKDFDHLSFPSRSFTHGRGLLFTKSQPATLSDNSGTEAHTSRQTIDNAPSSAEEQHARNADSVVSNSGGENSALNATVFPTQDPSSSSTRDTDRHKSTNDPVPPRPLSQSLPQSPFLKPGNEDEPPVKERKRKPTKEDKDRLRRNPWAMALASNVRLCSATGKRLPREFLVDFGLARHPEADNLWFMPKSLLVDEFMEGMKGGEEVGAYAAKEESGDSGSANLQPSKPQPHPKKDIRTITQGPKFYLLNRDALQKDLTAKPANAHEQVSRLIPVTWKAPMGKLGKNDLKSLVWREDMPEFVLGALRKEAVKSLKNACLENVRMNDPSGVWSLVTNHGDVVDEKVLRDGLDQIGELEGMSSGAVLVFGFGEKLEGNADGDVAVGEPTIQSATPSPPLPDLITLPNQGSQVPVFDLRALLSESDIEELRQHHLRFRKTALFFRPGENIRVDAMLALWRLKGYVMHDQDI